MIPEGWSIVRLGSLTRKIGSGLTPLGGQKSYLDYGIPLIRSQNVLNGKLVLNDVAYISDEQHQKMSNSMVRPNDVLLNITGASIGRCCTVPGDFAEGNVNQHVCIIRPGKKLDAVYLMSVLISSLGQKQIWQFQAGGNRQGLNFDQIRSFRLLLPPLPEQRAIAAILGTWDRAIALTERRLAAAEQRKQALMQQLLTGRVRFPEFAGEEWRVQRLGQLVNKTKGKVVDLNDAGQGIPYIGATSFSGDYTVFTTDKDSIKCQSTDVLILWDGENAGVSTTGLEGAVSSTVARLRPTGKASSKFLHYHIAQHNSQIRAIRQGSGIPHIPGDFLNWYVLETPSLPEQRRIAAVLNACDREIDLFRRKREALQRQKRGLMQRLLTGRVRVKV